MKTDTEAARSMILFPILRRVRSLGSFGANTIFTVAANLTIAAMGMGTGIIAARLLGVQGRGELAAIQTWPSFIGALAMMGMPEAIIYYSARDSDATGEYLGSGILLALIASLPFITVAYFMMPVLLHAQNPTIIRAARWYLFIVLIYATVGMLHHPLRGRNDFVPWNILRICPLLTWIAVLALTWILGRTTPRFLAGANLAGLTALLIPFMLTVMRRIPGPFLPDYRKFDAAVRNTLRDNQSPSGTQLKARPDAHGGDSPSTAARSLRCRGRVEQRLGTSNRRGWCGDSALSGIGE
jgi:O-antigen/teichoic acid export membrane protein